MGNRRHKTGKDRRRTKGGVEPPREPARRGPWRWVAACGVAGALALGVVVLRSTGRQPIPPELTPGSAAGFNVLLITLDTTRADRLGCYGYAKAETPVLDALANEGIRFDDAVTAVPVTLPAHATILTGLDPPNHGVRNNGEYQLAAEHETLAEVLGGKGYQTAAFVSAFVLDGRFGLDQGFDVYDDDLDFVTSDTSAALAKPIYERSAEGVTGAATRWLAARDESRPFFLWVHYFDPHHPYKAPAAVTARHRGRPYDAEIAYMDAQIGVLLKALVSSGSRDKTLIVVVADHGEGLGDHGEATHAKLIYESVMHVPLIVACPGVFRGPHEVTDVVVSIADVFPTVLELLGIDHAGAVDGISLLSATEISDRTVYMENLASYLDNGWSPLYGLRRHSDKYILAPRPEYYDLASDPTELHDRYTQVSGRSLTARDALVTELSKRLAKWPGLEAVVSSARQLDARSVQKLQALGYVGIVPDAPPPGGLADPKDMMPVMQALDRADALAAAGRAPQALALLKEAAAISRSDQRVQLTIGNLYLRMGRDEEAEAAFAAAVAANPSARILVQLAQIKLGADQPAKAAEVLEVVRETHPDNLDALITLGIAYLRMDQAEAACEVLLEANRLDDTRFEAYINLAACHRRTGRLADALTYADRAVTLAPRASQAHYNRALILKELQDNDGARTALLSAKALDARNPRIHQDLANVCARLGRLPEALSHFQTLAQLLPSRWEPQLGVARVNLQLGRLEDAGAALGVGLRIAPNEPRLRALAQRLAEARNR